MSATVSAPPRGRLNVVVNDPIGQRKVRLNGVGPGIRAKEIVALAASSLRLPPNIVFNLRDDVTSRLLPENQPMESLAQEEENDVQVSLQPDAGLG